MLSALLNKHHLILASASPRRQEFLKHLGLDFETRLKPIEEIYPQHLEHAAITNYLAKLKAEPFKHDLKENDILITSDTIVWHQNKALGKPDNADHAFKILKALSDSTHEVITSICISTTAIQKTVHDTTKVHFKALTDKEIRYYINTFKPFDKAGAYGIQEWIGQIGVIGIEGSYYNVMGLPTHLLYKTLLAIVNEN